MFELLLYLSLQKPQKLLVHMFIFIYLFIFIFFSHFYFKTYKVLRKML